MKYVLACMAAAVMLTACQTAEQEPLTSVIDRGLKVATEQALRMANELETQDGKLPRTLTPDGTLAASDYGWWCSGFFPGELWYLYEAKPTEELKKFAEMYTARVEPAKLMTNTHDLGFMLNCSFGNGYRLTQNPAYKDILITGAYSLITRYNSTICAIKSWDSNKQKWQFPVIIDNMMNLELLTWAARVTGDEQFNEIVHSHAHKTIDHHFRPDYSTYHVVSYDTISGLPHAKNTHQGYADESAWARGQVWGLYGYVAMYRETKKEEYLQQARRIAQFLMNHPNTPADKIPYWDFNAPDIPNAKRDASAGAIMASALLELSVLEANELGKQCRAFAEDQIRSLSSPAYLAEPGTNGYFTIMHCVGHLPGNSEVDVPLSYADYYYVEALLRLKDLLAKEQ